MYFLRHALRAAYRTAISAAQILVNYYYNPTPCPIKLTFRYIFYVELYSGVVSFCFLLFLGLGLGFKVRVTVRVRQGRSSTGFISIRR